MNRTLNLVLNSINLDGYGASQRFVGYFEQSGKYKPGVAETAVDFFIKFYEDSLHEFVILQSLHVNSDEFGEGGALSDDNDDAALLEFLVNTGKIPILSYRKQIGDDYQSEQYDASLEAIWRDFRVALVNDYDPADFRKVLVARMVADGLHGHCFLVSERLGLAYYPHDYMGFGVVALRDDANFPAAYEFLTRAGSLEDYFSIIKM